MSLHAQSNSSYVLQGYRDQALDAFMFATNVANFALLWNAWIILNLEGSF